LIRCRYNQLRARRPLARNDSVGQQHQTVDELNSGRRTPTIPQHENPNAPGGGEAKTECC